MKKNNCYLFLTSLVIAFLSFAAAIPGISGLVTNVYAVQPFEWNYG